MKIVYIANSSIPSRSANSVHVMKMCEAFADNGVDTVLIVPDTGEKHLLKSNMTVFDFYGVKENFLIKKIKISSKSGIRNYMYSLLAILKAMSFNPDLIYTRNPIVSLIATVFKQKNILEMHGILQFVSYKLYKLYKLYKPFLKSSFLKLVVISTPLKKYYMKEFAIPDKKIMILPDGVNIEAFIECNENFLNRSFLKICYVGALYKGRGIELILDVAKKDNNNLYYIWGGEEEHIIYWKKEADKIKVKNVKFMGFIPNKKVPEVLCQCDVLLMPYQRVVLARGRQNTANWMSPMKMFEYMASGRVILASDLPVLREVLNERNAILLPPDNPEEWLKAIRWINNNREKAKILGKRAREDVKNYTWKERAQKIIKIIKELKEIK